MKTKLRMGAALGVVALAVITLGACFPGQSIEGTWSGMVIDTYLCEATPYSIELTFTEDTVAVTGGTVTDGAITSGSSGTYELIDEGRFSFVINDDGALSGIFAPDAASGNAVIVFDNPFGGQSGFVGGLQLSSLQTMNATVSDLVGTWDGVGVSVDSSYNVVETQATELTITEPETLEVSGTYGNASISNGTADIQALDATLGYYSGQDVLFSPETPYDVAMTLSYDEQWLAVAYLTSGCDPTLFDNLPAQKFALYERQP